MGFNRCVSIHEVAAQSHTHAACLMYHRFIDPTLDHDLGSQHKPWALSPLISTMPYFAHARIPNLKKISDLPPFPPPISITEDSTQLSQATNPDAVPDEAAEPVAELMKLHTSAERRAHFHQKEARKQITFGPDVSHIL